MTPLFSLKLANKSASVLGWERIDVIQLMPCSITPVTPFHIEDRRTERLNYGCLYLADKKHLTLCSWEEDLFPEIENGTYKLIIGGNLS